MVAAIGRQTRPSGPLAATSATPVARAAALGQDLDDVADGGVDAADQQVQAEQLGDDAEPAGLGGERARSRRRSEGRSRRLIREHLPDALPGAVETRTSTTPSSVSTTASPRSSDGSATTVTRAGQRRPASGSGGFRGADADARRPARPGSEGERPAYGVESRASAATASSWPTSSSVSGERDLRSRATATWSQAVGHGGTRASAAARLRACDGGLVLAPRGASSPPGAARRRSRRGSCGLLLRGAPTLGPADGVALGARRRAAPARRARTACAR